MTPTVDVIVPLTTIGDSLAISLAERFRADVFEDATGRLCVSGEVASQILDLGDSASPLRGVS